MLDIAKYKEECFDVIGALYNVKKELGPGLNEKIYQEGLAMELSLQKIPFEREKPIHPVYRGKQMESIFFLDFLQRNGDSRTEIGSSAEQGAQGSAVQLYAFG